ncbi:MAG TPA: serine hydroxymethyltransferase, partial [Arthrobacter sp.]|nr:serine hydroxymethyltransferase [Arthrobacter sp.]
QVAHRLRRANLLTCGIGLPAPLVEGDMNGLRIGTPEIVRRGMRPADMPELAGFIARGLDPDTDPEQVAPEVSAWRKQFDGIHFTADNPN